MGAKILPSGEWVKTPEPTAAEKEELKAALESMNGANWISMPEGVQIVMGEGLHLKLGPLEIELTDRCMGKVTYRGQRVPITALRIEGKAGEGFKVSIDPALILDD